MWLSKIFAREFGFSDVQSNYSRVYAWMANQLGHMTLGMATVFLFVWIAESVEALALDMRAGGGWGGALAAACADSRGACVSHILLSFAVAVIVGALLFASYKGIRGDPKRRRTEATFRAALAARYYFMPEASSRLLHLVVLIGAVWLVWSLASQMAAEGAGPSSSAAHDAARRLGVGVSIAGFAIASATLCRDTRFIIIGGMPLFAAYWIATGAHGFGPEGKAALPGLLAVIFVAHSVLVMVLLARAPERFDRREAVVQILTNLIIGSLFIYGDRAIADPDWRIAVGAGIASLTIWWIKEFASDLPNVHLEIAQVAAKRPPQEILGDCRQVERDYFADARMDARTDALFYFAGAWIGAGVVSPVPVLTDLSWRSGSEILGLLIFLGVFLLLGRNWAYRQLALDLMGALRASRLAVFHSALWMRVADVAKGRFVKPAAETDAEGFIKDPLLVLRDYAGDIGDDALPESRFHHLFVFGARGSGRTALGRAIASEAALADWPTLFFQRRRKAPREGDRRTARYIVGSRLPNYLFDVERETDIAATPTVPIHIHKETGAADRDPARLPAGDKRIEEAASLVVIDDVSPAMATDEATRKAMLANLMIAEGQQTVWLIEIEEPAGPDWSRELARAVEAVSPLVLAVAGSTPADDCCRVGLALAKRTSRLAR